MNKNIKDKKDTTYTDWAVLIGAIVYFVAPIDLIPDVAPMGFLDDTALLTAAFKAAKSLFTATDMSKANAKAAALLGDHFDVEKARKMTQDIIETTQRYT